MKKLALFNMKGGVGKSTLATNISHGLALAGYKVLLVDMDNQNDCSLFLGIDEKDYNKTFFNLIDKRYPASLSDCIIQARDNLDLLPNSDYEIIKNEFHREPNINEVMDEALQGVGELDYDYVIFDCSPSRGVINDAIMYYVDYVAIPVQLEAASIRGVKNIYSYLDRLKINREKIQLIIPNMHDTRTNESTENLEKLNKAFEEENIVSSPVLRRIKIAESGNYGKTIYEYHKSTANQFSNVLMEVAKIGE